MSPNAITRENRFARLVLHLATFLMALVLADNVTFHLFTPANLRGTDYLVVGVAAVFLLMRWLRPRWAGKLAISLLAMFFVVAVVEVGFWLVRPTDRPFGWYVWPPNYSRLMEPKLLGVATRGVMTTNSRGIRGPEFSPNDRLRILCIGGSTTECLYLDDAKTWPALLAAELDAADRHLWVGNVGRSGHTTAQHALVMEMLPEAKEADIWIVLAGLNDVSHQLAGEFDAQLEPARNFQLTFYYRRPGFSGELRRPYQRNLTLYDFAEALRRRAKTWLKGRDASVYQDVRAMWVEQRASDAQRIERLTTMPDVKPYLDQYESMLMRMITVAKAQRKVLVLMTQPMLWDADLPENLRRMCAGVPAGGGRYYELGLSWAAMKRYNERMLAVCRREGVLCIDLASVIPKSTDCFYDECHFNENGAKVVARLVKEGIGEMVKQELERRRAGDAR